MNTKRSSKVAGAAGRLGGFLLLLATAGPGAVRAQEAPRPPAASGWLGVGLMATSACRPEPGVGRVSPSPEAGRRSVRAVTRACEGPAVVGSVVMGSPADRAGLQPGDTLVAVDGDRVEGGPTDVAFRELRAGEPLTLTVGRGGDRLEITVSPAPRPERLALVQVPRPPDAARPAPVPAPGRESRREYRLAVPATVQPSAAGVDGGDVVVVRVFSSSDPERPVREIVPLADSAFLSLHVTGAGPARVAARGGAEMAAAARAMDSLLFRVSSPPAGDAGAPGSPGAAAEWRALMSEEFRARLESIHDSALEAARARLEAMRPELELRARRARALDSARSALQGSTETGPEVAAESRAALRSSLRAVERLRSGGWDVFEFGNARLAGAELHAVNPELADALGSVEHGILVLRVLPETPAARLGLRPGDVVVEVAGEPVATVHRMRWLLATHAAADRGPEVKWVRKGATHTGTLRD